MIKSLRVDWEINDENYEHLNNAKAIKKDDGTIEKIADSITVSDVLKNPVFCEDFKKRVRHCAVFTGDK
jgi:hypothetical protein